ncbi:MAG: hypothetical protein WCO56_00635 [Verrucomicrobiota bacterium]
MQRIIGIIAFTLFCVAAMAATETLTLKDGSTKTGEVSKSTFAKDGVMLKQDGRFTDRVKWKDLDKATVNRLANNPDARKFIPEEMIERPVEQIREEKRQARQITVRPLEVPLDRGEKPAAKTAALFASPVTLILLGLMFGLNIYAAYEIAIFKNRPAWLVCGFAVVAPILGNLAFYAIPAARIKSPEELDAEAAAVLAAQQPEEIASEQVYHEETPAEAEVVVSEFPPTINYTKGQFIFNRRFFESKLADFLKLERSDLEKDMVIIIRSARGEYQGTRLSKVEVNEIFLQVEQGEATMDVNIPYLEITEVILKHKDAPL